MITALSRLSSPLIVLALLCGADVHAQAPGATRVTDELVQPADPSASPQAQKEHTFRVAAGQLVEVRLDADDFDTVLQLVPPSGDTLYNDDYQSTRTSRIATIAAVGGEWRAIVTALDLGGGPYELSISLGTPGSTREINGALTSSSEMSAKGQRYARHTYDLDGSSQLVVQLSSDDFEPELVIHSPSGEIVNEIADYATPRVVTVTLPSADAGEWEIIATHSAYTDQQLGGYTIQIVEAETPAMADGDVMRGELSEASPRQIHGERYAEHRIAGSAAGMSINLTSREFDAYLAVRSPSGEWFRDDDSAGDGNAMLRLPGETGEWLAIVTSYAPEETGRYELTVYR